MENDFKEYQKRYDISQNTDDANDKVVITMEHVCSIFAILGFGLVLAFFAFIGEHLTYFIKRRKITRVNVDSEEAVVEALVVPNVTQNIPVLVGQTFLNNVNNEIVMIVAGDKVRILSTNNEIAHNLDICPGKVPLWAETSTVIALRTTALVLVTSRGICNGNVYLQERLRMFPCKEYVLDSCITRAEGGIIFTTNLLKQDIQVSTKNVLARSTLCFEDKASISSLTCASSNQIGNSFSIDDIIFNENLKPQEIEMLIELINEFCDRLAQNTSQLEKTSILKMSIPLNDDSPVVYDFLTMNEKLRMR
ncbi:hypothetical protein RN001_014878 [Aquatica leii]|uniref:Uncharacterized protein n=1 Tax=Aquatica leii TaxID=1421715 RepID=A0AAN7SBX8_9COLE|nr:hypothetical protein RN001_014878 [Aquatica leii]